MKQLSACVTCMARLTGGYYNNFYQSSNNDIDIQWHNQSNLGKQCKTMIINDNDVHPLFQKCMVYQIEFEILRKKKKKTILQTYMTQQVEWKRLHIG